MTRRPPNLNGFLHCRPILSQSVETVELNLTRRLWLLRSVNVSSSEMEAISSRLALVKIKNTECGTAAMREGMGNACRDSTRQLPYARNRLVLPDQSMPCVYRNPLAFALASMRS